MDNSRATRARAHALTNAASPGSARQRTTARMCGSAQSPASADGWAPDRPPCSMRLQQPQPQRQHHLPAAVPLLRRRPLHHPRRRRSHSRSDRWPAERRPPPGRCSVRATVAGATAGRQMHGTCSMVDQRMEKTGLVQYSSHRPEWEPVSCGVLTSDRLQRKGSRPVTARVTNRKRPKPTTP